MRFVLAGGLAVVVIIAGCGGAPPRLPSATPAPPTPSSQPGVAASSTPRLPVDSPATTVAPAAAATLAPIAASPSAGATGDLASDLVGSGQLIICSSFPRVRFAERDANGQPFGVDVEIGQAIARRLSMEPDLREVLFESLLDAVAGGSCDVSIAGQFITAGRLVRIDMIAYRQGSPHVIVQVANPLGIRELSDLCGRALAVVSGSVYVELVRGLGDFAGKGIDDQCRAAGKPVIDLREFPTQKEAEDALARGDADAYIGNDFVTVERPQDFALSAPLPPLRNGIGLRKGASLLNAGVKAALGAMIDDGAYLAILEKYGAADAALSNTD